jgi:predicted nucleic acid-binding protein
MSERVFLDTNVVIDLLGEREPFYGAAARLATLAERGKIHASVSALTWATVYYVLSKFESRDAVRHKISLFKSLVTTVDLTNRDIHLGLSTTFNDFEDALQYFAAIRAGCKVFITRNVKDFKSAEIPVFSPDEYLGTIRR